MSNKKADYLPFSLIFTNLINTQRTAEKYKRTERFHSGRVLPENACNFEDFFALSNQL